MTRVALRSFVAPSPAAWALGVILLVGAGHPIAAQSRAAEPPSTANPLRPTVPVFELPIVTDAFAPGVNPVTKLSRALIASPRRKSAQSASSRAPMAMTSAPKSVSTRADEGPRPTSPVASTPVREIPVPAVRPSAKRPLR